MLLSAYQLHLQTWRSLSISYKEQQNEGFSGARTRGNGVSTPFSCLSLKWVRSCFKMASFFGCVPTPLLLALYPWLTPSHTDCARAASTKYRTSKYACFDTTRTLDELLHKCQVNYSILSNEISTGFLQESYFHLKYYFLPRQQSVKSWCLRFPRLKWSISCCFNSFIWL